MYLIDTSALYPLIKYLREEIIDYTDQFRILDLTLYEVGNVIWKEYRRGLIKNLTKTVKMFTAILDSIEKISIKPNDLSEIVSIALNNNISFYDASYIFIANKYGYTLVSEDNDIIKNYEKAINTNQLLRKLGITP